MPDRILRDELLESERWLGLADNTLRLAFVCLIPTADALGNMEANQARLWRLWRDTLALDGPESVPAILKALAKADLIRPYNADGRELIHIPRYRQRLRHLGRLWPLSPWTTDDEKQRVAKNSPDEGQASDRSESAKRGRREVEVEVEVEVKRREKKKASVPTDAQTQPDQHAQRHGGLDSHPKVNGNSSAWQVSLEALTAKGRELGMEAHIGESAEIFRSRVSARIAADKAGRANGTQAQTIGEAMRDALKHLHKPE